VDDQILQSEEKNNATPVAETPGAPLPDVASLEPVAGADAEARAPETAAATEADETAPKPEGPRRAWYVVHCYSGYENKVKKGLDQRVKSMPPEQKMEELIFRAIVPTEEELDLREGQRKLIQRRVFPGYILVEMIMTEESWYVVRNTPGVTGFVSSGDKPTPLREDEVNKILKRMETAQPQVRVTYRPGQVVHIIDGPFADFRGTVDEVNMEKGKVRVMVSFFGRETPVELDLLQVQKV
jgi:transcriptional antiterminator NusG